MLPNEIKLLLPEKEWGGTGHPKTIIYYREMNEGRQSAHQQAFANFQLTLELIKRSIPSVLDDVQNWVVNGGRKQYYRGMSIPCWGAQSDTQSRSLPPFPESQVKWLFFIFQPPLLILRLQSRVFYCYFLIPYKLFIRGLMII